MKSFVITILDNDRSVQVAERCIKSAAKFDIKVEKWKAFTPKDDPKLFAELNGIPTKGFKEVYSRFENCLSAFISHYQLWQYSVEHQEDVLIMEHDAFVMDSIPRLVDDIVNLGEPSYGKYNLPKILGLNPLTSKSYFPGAHGYFITPRGASSLISLAKTDARPTDIFINNKNFHNLKEYYPWPIQARDSFTTIQNEKGCLAKHSYGETYEII
jgi:GR25 family glycosyltransferase involved in LPS biosynthesis